MATHLKKMIFSSLFVLLLVNEAITLRIRNRIVNGSNAEQGQFPHNVELGVRDERIFFCGGSIITNWHILSAAHCVKLFVTLPENLQAYFDAWKNDEPAYYAYIEQVIIHPEYADYHDDISLLRTTTEIIFSENIRPIALPTTNLAQNFDTFRALVAGWGAMWVSSEKNIVFPLTKKFNYFELKDPKKDMKHSSKPRNLKYQETLVIDKKDCLNVFQAMQSRNHFNTTELIENFDDNTICTWNSRGKGVCRGDSGNGLVHDATLIGVVSSSFGCAMGYPDLYTKVYSYNDWITSEARRSSGGKTLKVMLSNHIIQEFL